MIEHLVQEKSHLLTSIDWEIYHYVLNSECPSEMTMQDIASHCHISTTTVFRFCKKLGLSGFGELKVLLKNRQSNQVPEMELPDLYHQIVEYINRYDTTHLSEKLLQVETIYILARSEKELRLAKEMQRIFLQKNIMLFILPNHYALESQLPFMENALLWILQIDFQGDYPAMFYRELYQDSLYIVYLASSPPSTILVDELILLPKFKSLNPLIHIEEVLTPYILCVEMLYLKLLLE